MQTKIQYMFCLWKVAPVVPWEQPRPTCWGSGSLSYVYGINLPVILSDNQILLHAKSTHKHVHIHKLHTLCRVWVLECSPKAHVLKIWSPSVALLGGGGTFKRWGLMGGSWVIRSVPLEGIIGPWSLPVSLFCILATKRWMVCFSTCSRHDILGSHQPKSSRATWSRTEISETVSQNKPFFLLS
jgi:hypothetical protein